VRLRYLPPESLPDTSLYVILTFPCDSCIILHSDKFSHFGDVV
jgi:hypothetical protein